MPVASTFTVRTGSFEGPLEVLLDLIERRKLLINEVSLSRVAEEYIQHVSSLPVLPVEETAEFVSLAATLLLIKSRSLLPLLELSEEEEGDIGTLELRLALYKVVRAASRGLASPASPPLLPLKGFPREPIFVPHESMTLSALTEALEGILAAFPKDTFLPKVTAQTVLSLEAMIGRLADRVARATSLSFRDFAGSTASRAEIIVGFLALLELVKQGILKANQQDAGGDILLESDSVGTPSYE